jgi:hypothetical protein
MKAAALAAVVAMRRLEVATLGGGGGTRRPFDLPRKKGSKYTDLRDAREYGLNHDLKPRIQRDERDSQIAIATHLHGLQHLAQLAGSVLQLVEERHVRRRAPGLGDTSVWCEVGETVKDGKSRERTRRVTVGCEGMYG